MSLRVLVVDDTVLFRRALSDALAGMPGVEVVGTAPSGRLALAKIAELQPNLLTLDIDMPDMNGIEVLQALNATGLDIGTIMVSSLTMRGGRMTMRALELGAFDFLTKPDGAGAAKNVAILRDGLLPIIQAYCRCHEIRSILKGNAPAVVRDSMVPAAAALMKPGTRAFVRTGPPVVLIGVSTGGPVALAKIVPTLPRDLGAPVFIVQHMPAPFTRALADSLAAKSAICVKEAVDGEHALTNCAYIAPGGMQMKLTAGSNGEIIVRIVEDPPEHNCKPSVDYLFRSAALNFPGRSIAAILTGMGTDGTAGLRLLKSSGCFTIAQDEASCVVFGMPREAINAGLVDAVEPLNHIADAIVRCIRGAHP